MSQIITTGWTVLDASYQAPRDVVGKVEEDAWTRPTPCANWTVAQVLQHAVGDQLAYASFLTGSPLPTWDPFAPSGTLTEPPAAFLKTALDASAAAWAAVEGGVDVPTPLPQGTMPAQRGAGACALDAAIHAWDIAMATDQPSPLTDDLAKPLMEVALTIVEPLRTYGAYAAALPPEAGDDDTATLLRYLGRRPTWA